MERALTIDLPGCDSLSELTLDEVERRARAIHGGRALPLREWVALAEAWRIAHALRESRGNRSAAARSLGIGRRTLYTKIEKLGLTPAWVLAPERSGAATSPREAAPPSTLLLAD